jgi:hypothetical protein
MHAGEKSRRERIHSVFESHERNTGSINLALHIMFLSGPPRKSGWKKKHPPPKKKKKKKKKRLLGMRMFVLLQKCCFSNLLDDEARCIWGRGNKTFWAATKRTASWKSALNGYPDAVWSTSQPQRNYLSGI